MIVIIWNPKKLCYVLVTFAKSLRSSCLKDHNLSNSSFKHNIKEKKLLRDHLFYRWSTSQHTFTFPRLATHPCRSFHSYLQFSSCIEFLQAIYSLLSVHHRGNSRTLLREEEKKHFNAPSQTSSILLTLQHTYYNPHGPNPRPLISTLSDYPYVHISTHWGNLQITKTKGLILLSLSHV